MSEVKLKDIAGELGVSIVTVSNALAGKKGVSESVRAEITETARKMGYDTARYQKRDKNVKIGVVAQRKYLEVGASFYWAMYQQVAYEASKRKYFTMFEFMEDENSPRSTSLMMTKEKDLGGLIIIGKVSRRRVERILREAGVPVILLDFCMEDLECDAVMSNNYLGMYKMTRYLLERGHQKIGFAGSVRATDNILERYLGFRKAMGEWGIPVMDKWIIEDRDLRSGKPAIRLPDELPTAFVCNCDHTAGYLYNRLREKGYRVPEDISIVSYDNYLVGNAFADHLTTYNVDMKRMAEAAVDILIKKRKYPNREQSIRYIDSAIVERSSVKNLNEAIFKEPKRLNII